MAVNIFSSTKSFFVSLLDPKKISIPSLIAEVIKQQDTMELEKNSPFLIELVRRALLGEYAVKTEILEILLNKTLKPSLSLTNSIDWHEILHAVSLIEEMSLLINNHFPSNDEYSRITSDAMSTLNQITTEFRHSDKRVEFFVKHKIFKLMKSIVEIKQDIELKSQTQPRRKPDRFRPFEYGIGRSFDNDVCRCF